MPVSMNGVNNSVMPRIYDGPENLSPNNAMYAAYPENFNNYNGNKKLEMLINSIVKNSRVNKHSKNVNMHRRALRMMKRSGLPYNAAMNLVLEDDKIYQEDAVRDHIKRQKEAEKEANEKGYIRYWDMEDGRFITIPRGGSKGHLSRKARRTRKHKKTRRH